MRFRAGRALFVALLLSLAPSLVAGSGHEGFMPHGGQAPDAAPAAITRLWGQDRYATAAAISQSVFPARTAVAYIATGRNYPDALAGGAAAAQHNAPLLLVEPTRVPAATAAELRRLSPDRIVVLGGTGAVSAAVAAALVPYARTGQVTRRWGQDRYATAAAISQSVFPARTAVAYIATGRNYPDALAGGAAAAQHNAPLLLVEPTRVPAATAAELRRLSPDRIVVLGGTGAVSAAVAAALVPYARTGQVTRRWGQDRYATAAAISQSVFPARTAVAYIATGRNYPDALAGGAAAAQHNAPLLLVEPTRVPAATAAELRRLSPDRIVVLGGTGAVSAAVAAALSNVAAPPVAGLNVRPYSAGSAWNTPIAAGAAADPNSAQLIAGLGVHNGGRLTSDPEQYTFPVYFADANTPRYNVPCRTYRCTVVSASGTTSTDVLQGVPIPVGARPAAGSDAQMIIIDTASGTEWDVWQASFDGSGWSVSNGSVYNINWDGMPTRYGSRGAGVPYYAGLIRPWEIAAGRIDHALAFAYPAPASGRCVWPASKTDGNTAGNSAIPEGARLQLDPNLTDADFAAMGLNRTGVIIARALQQYGMILIDVSGRPKIYAENLLVNPAAGYSWADPAIALNSTTISAIPHTAFRVLDLPDGYWTGSGSLHGGCYR